MPEHGLLSACAQPVCCGVVVGGAKWPVQPPALQNSLGAAPIFPSASTGSSRRRWQARRRLVRQAPAPCLWYPCGQRPSRWAEVGEVGSERGGERDRRRARATITAPAAIAKVFHGLAARGDARFPPPPQASTGVHPISSALPTLGAEIGAIQPGLHLLRGMKKSLRGLKGRQVSHHPKSHVQSLRGWAVRARCDGMLAGMGRNASSASLGPRRTLTRPTSDGRRPRGMCPCRDIWQLGSSVQRQGLARGPAWRPELSHAPSCRRWRAGRQAGRPAGQTGRGMPCRETECVRGAKKKISAHANLPTRTLASGLHSSLDRPASSRANFLQHAATASLGQH
jgi:hypothetical protein